LQKMRISITASLCMHTRYHLENCSGAWIFDILIGSTYCNFGWYLTI